MKGFNLLSFFETRQKITTKLQNLGYGWLNDEERFVLSNHIGAVCLFAHILIVDFVQWDEGFLDGLRR